MTFAGCKRVDRRPSLYMFSCNFDYFTLQPKASSYTLCNISRFCSKNQIDDVNFN